MIKLDDQSTWPEIGSLWVHRNGISYSVEDFANVSTQYTEKYPIMIIYRNQQTRKIWCRELIDWERSMTLLSR